MYYFMQGIGSIMISKKFILPFIMIFAKQSFREEYKDFVYCSGFNRYDKCYYNVINGDTKTGMTDLITVVSLVIPVMNFL